MTQQHDKSKNNRAKLMKPDKKGVHILLFHLYAFL